MRVYIYIHIYIHIYIYYVSVLCVNLDLDIRVYKYIKNYTVNISIYPYMTCTTRVIRVDFKFEASPKMHRAGEHQSVAEGRHRIRLCPAHLGVNDSCDSNGGNWGNPGVSLQNLPTRPEGHESKLLVVTSPKKTNFSVMSEMFIGHIYT